MPIPETKSHKPQNRWLNLFWFSLRLAVFTFLKSEGDPRLPLPRDHFKGFALLSWFAPAIAILFALINNFVFTAPKIYALALILCICFTAAGSVATIAAFFGMVRHGWRGILLPAICGLILCGAILVGFATGKLLKEPQQIQRLQ